MRVCRRNWIHFMWRAIVHYLTRTEVNVCVGLTEMAGLSSEADSSTGGHRHGGLMLLPHPAVYPYNTGAMTYHNDVSLWTAKYHSCHPHCLVHGSVRRLSADLNMTLRASQ